MHETVSLTEIDLQIIDLVVSQFIHEKKPTPRRQLLLKFQDPDRLEDLITRALLKDVNRQAVLPSLISFYFYRDEAEILRTRESLQNVLHVLRAFYFDSEEDKQLTLPDIAAKAEKIGRTLDHESLWLGLYLVQNYFGVLGSWSGSAETGDLNWLKISEGILRFKDIDNVWETRMKQEVESLIHRDSYRLVPTPQQLPDDSDIFSANVVSEAQKQPELSIFISHSSKDAEVAFGLIELLKASLNLKDKQIRCTSVDGFRLPAGANTDDVLKAEVLEAKAFIGLITPNSLASAYVLFELGARWGGRQHMVPVLAGIGTDALHGPLQGINSVSADKIAQLHQLVSELASFLNLELQTASSYVRYAQKLIDQVHRTYQTQSNPHVSSSHPPSDVKQAGGERKLRTLTRDAVIEASKSLGWDKQLPKWTVMIEGISFPVRPLALRAAGLLPNDSATTHQAVSILKQLGFRVFYENKPA